MSTTVNMNVFEKNKNANIDSLS
uniref:Uncharacterized protein n=1 Tax=Anguilla anguilla TaxID=7936 RepID=A0A0E9QSQ3_ANGAN